ncbi:MAG: hypothetical protein HF962_09530 [Sulfurovum sp.]|nr:hypothetical protein [Sulfurovum sp.]
MLAIQINNPDLEKTLNSQFKTVEEMKNYLSELIIEDLMYRNGRKDLTGTVRLALEDISLSISGGKQEKRARDFLNEL